MRSPFWNISLAPTSEQVLSLHHSLEWCEVYRDWPTRTCTFIVWTQVNAVIIASLRHFSVPIGGEKNPFVFSYGGRSTVGTSSQGVPWTVWVEARWSVLVTLMWDILKILVWEKVHEAKKRRSETGFKFPKQNYLACCKTFLLISMLGMSALKINVCGRIALKQTSNWNFLVLKYTEKKKNWVFPKPGSNSEQTDHN